MSKALKCFRDVSVRYDATGELFEKLHSQGAAKFGAMWLDVNSSIVEHLGQFIDVSDPAVKQLLTAAAMRALVRLESTGAIKPRPPLEIREAP